MRNKKYNAEIRKELNRLVKLGLLKKGKRGYIDSDYSKKIDAMKPRVAFLEGLKKGKKEILDYISERGFRKSNFEIDEVIKFLKGKNEK